MATVQVQVNADVERRATDVLKDAGLTVEQAVQEMLERTAVEGSLPFFTRGRMLEPDDPEHDEWFRAQVQEALDDPEPGIPHEEAERLMAEHRAAFAASRSRTAA